MALVPENIELYVHEDEKILPGNQTPPWPKAFFIKIYVRRFVHVYHMEGIYQNSEGEIVKLCQCFDPVEVGTTLYNTFYHHFEELNSCDRAAEFFDEKLYFFGVPGSVEKREELLNDFSIKLQPIVRNARAYLRKVVPVTVEIKIDVGEEYCPPGLDLCRPRYVEAIMRAGSHARICEHLYRY